MIALGQHWEFIAAAYLGSVLVVGGLIVWTALSARAAGARLATLDAARPARKPQ